MLSLSMEICGLGSKGIVVVWDVFCRQSKSMTVRSLLSSCSNVLAALLRVLPVCGNREVGRGLRERATTRIQFGNRFRSIGPITGALAQTIAVVISPTDQSDAFTTASNIVNHLDTFPWDWRLTQHIRVNDLHQRRASDDADNDDTLIVLVISTISWYLDHATYKPPSRNIPDIANFCSFRICMRQTFDTGRVNMMISITTLVTAPANRAPGQLIQWPFSST